MLEKLQDIFSINLNKIENGGITGGNQRTTWENQSCGNQIGIREKRRIHNQTIHIMGITTVTTLL